jgi:transposase IS116/IS110/IS902 family protein
VIRQLQRHLDYLQLRIAWLRRETLRVIACDLELNRRFRLMLTTPGIGETSALQILGELAVLPDTLDARQWVAFAGLDPLRFKFWHFGGKETADQPWRQSSSAARFVHASVGCHTSRAPSASFLSAAYGLAEKRRLWQS